MPSFIHPIVLVGAGATFIETDDPAEAALAGRVFAAQWRYVHGRALPAELFGHLGLRVAGRLVETDPAALDELGRRGEFDLAEVYRELFG